MAPFQSAADAQNPANPDFAHETEGWFVRKFDPGIHVHAQLPPPLRSDSFNPNLKKPLVQRHTYAESLQTAYPGIEYDTGGAPVRAVAAGIVHFIGETPKKAGAPGGFYVRIAHDLVDGLVKDSYPRATLYRDQVYRSSYYYLSRVSVKHWQAIKRGAIVGYGTHLDAGGPTVARLVLEERGNWVDPDNYGKDHGYMTYKDNAGDEETALEEMNRRLEHQNYLVRELNAYYGERETDDIYAKIHTVIDTEKFKRFPVRWSTLERFRYLGYRYGTRPDLFLGLPAERFAGLEKSFYAHQPIVLTLPFEK